MFVQSDIRENRKINKLVLTREKGHVIEDESDFRLRRSLS